MTHPSSSSSAVDPVCGMTVDPKRAAASSDHEGTTYWFCSKSCKQRFDANPASYVTAAKS